MKYGYGVDLGGTTVKIAFFDETGTMLHKWEIPTVTENNGAQILPDIADAIKEHIASKELKKEDLIGVGIGVPGPVNHEGVVNRCINLGWGVFNVAQQLTALVDLPVKAGNDATVAALGECWKGGGAGCRNMVFVTLGTGVGGGIIAEGHVLYGQHGSGAEFGHTVVNRDETEVCPCGNKGCVEQYCSATGVVRMTKKALENCQTPSALRSLDKITCKAVFDAGKAGDPVALQVLEQFNAYLGECLANVCSTVNPEVVVIGGGVSAAGQIILDGLKPYFKMHVFHAAVDVQFRLAQLGNDAGAYGAFKLILDSNG